MNRERHRQVIHRYFDELWSAGRLDIAAELIHPGYVNHAPGLPDLPPGHAGIVRIVAAMRHGLPDLRYQILHELYDGDLAAVRTLVRGTHTGDLFGHPPSGRRFEVEQMQFERFADGRIIEHWRRTDEIGWARQLGW
jgi:predicted ester cyclase